MKISEDFEKAATPSEDGGECIARAFITGESGDGEYRVVMKFESLADMQAAHNHLIRLPHQSAQPARQVGVDERAEFLAWATNNWTGSTESAWKVWAARAMLGKS